MGKFDIVASISCCEDKKTALVANWLQGSLLLRLKVRVIFQGVNIKSTLLYPSVTVEKLFFNPRVRCAAAILDLTS